jgi:hypothetical protein
MCCIFFADEFLLGEAEPEALTVLREKAQVGPAEHLLEHRSLGPDLTARRNAARRHQVRIQFIVDRRHRYVSKSENARTAQAAKISHCCTSILAW